MFNKPNEELDISGLEDFIEKPCQECSDEELKKGVSKVLIVLNKSPMSIMHIISSHPFISANFLLDDLADKLKKQNCIEKLGILFDKCLDGLVEACIYNEHDLRRLVQSLPMYANKVIENLLSHEDRVKDVLEASKDPENTLKEIIEQWPQYKEKFSELYDKMNKPSISGLSK